ncbi:hypothetical protein B0H63DRAFT_560972 [Podospora didyma]|uniref:Uncharacterized protein n=1 Tax=Podospora didyma TaxID=330526 RepID=A0AAE0TVP2_9PEZI|nr:hypothetical protein B0H63DRAFT_560972 [Podospora didyma]
MLYRLGGDTGTGRQCIPWSSIIQGRRHARMDVPLPSPDFWTPPLVNSRGILMTLLLHPSPPALEMEGVSNTSDRHVLAYIFCASADPTHHGFFCIRLHSCSETWGVSMYAIYPKNTVGMLRPDAPNITAAKFLLRLRHNYRQSYPKWTALSFLAVCPSAVADSQAEVVVLVSFGIRKHCTNVFCAGLPIARSQLTGINKAYGYFRRQEFSKLIHTWPGGEFPDRI